MVSWAVALLLVLLGAAEVSGQTATSRRSHRVLAVYSDDRVLYAVQDVEDGLRSALLADPDLDLEYYSEFMDMVRFDEARDRAAFLEFLQLRYQSRAPDVMLAVGRPALEFLLDHRHDLFPVAPIVHVGVSGSDRLTEVTSNDVAGFASTDPADALGLVLRLQPDVRHVVVVGGTSASDRARLSSVRAAADRLSGRIQFTWLTEHTLQQVQAAVRTLPAHTAVLFVTMFQDAAEKVRFSRDALEQLAPASSVPVYGNFESYVGYGIVGGTMETWKDTGTESGRLVLRILRGQSPREAMGDRQLPVRTIVDWRQVERFGLQRAAFPAGTEFRFRQPTLWDTYRTQVLIAAAVGLAQLLLIATLGVALQRRRVAEATRREAEAKAADLRRELAHASRVTLLGELAATLAHEINQPLAAILSNAQATRRWLKSDAPDLTEIRATVDDIIADDKRAGEIIQRMRTLLRKGDPEHTRFDLGGAVRSIAALLHGELIVSNVTLDLRLPPEPIDVHGDEVATQQVILNLMLNGIQSIQEADSSIRRVSVTIDRIEGRVRILVHDTGRGVSDDAREKIFEPFFSTKARGLGVGLSICRRIAEAQGGTLGLAASPGGGATFALDIPTPARAA